MNGTCCAAFLAVRQKLSRILLSSLPLEAAADFTETMVLPSRRWIVASFMWENRRCFARCAVLGIARITAHPPCQFEIEFGEPTGIMRVQLHLDGLVDIRPVGVMIELFGGQRRARHEAEGLAEILEDEGPGNRQPVAG